MTQGGKDMTEGQWRGMLGRQYVRDALDQSYSRPSSYFSHPTSDFPLTYRSELINEVWGKGTFRTSRFAKHKLYHTVLGPHGILRALARDGEPVYYPCMRARRHV